MSANEIRDLNRIYLEAVYGGEKKKEEPKDTRHVVTRADKVGNTPAYQRFKAGDKNYKAADHLKDDKDWGYDKKGNSLNPVDIEKKKRKDDDLAGAPKNEAADLAPTVKKNFGAEDIAKAKHQEPMPTLKKNPVKEDYETKKKEEVLSAMKRQGRKLSDKEKEKIAAKVVKDKGDTSKSDDRYAYEELTHLRSLVEKKDKDTPDQVKAVISYDKARKATDDATYDTEHGDKEQAKKEKDYAKWQRDQGAEDAQKSGHPWEHAKGSTREKEGKKSEKHAHIKDSYERESQLWDEVAVNLTELHELGGVKFKVVPFDLEEDKKWIQGAVKRPGAFTKKAKAAGMSVQQFAKHVDANKDDYSTRTERQANLAQTFASMKKEGADYDSLSEFLINEGADEEAVNHIMANWLLEGYQRDPEGGEEKERQRRRSQKGGDKTEKVRGERTPMPPRGDKRREDFEKWYAANVR